MIMRKVNLFTSDGPLPSKQPNHAPTIIKEVASEASTIVIIIVIIRRRIRRRRIEINLLENKPVDSLISL